MQNPQEESISFRFSWKPYACPDSILTNLPQLHAKLISKLYIDHIEQLSFLVRLVSPLNSFVPRPQIAGESEVQIGQDGLSFIDCDIGPFTFILTKHATADPSPTPIATQDAIDEKDVFGKDQVGRSRAAKAKKVSFRPDHPPLRGLFSASIQHPEDAPSLIADDPTHTIPAVLAHRFDIDPVSRIVEEMSEMCIKIDKSNAALLNEDSNYLNNTSSSLEVHTPTVLTRNLPQEHRIGGKKWWEIGPPARLLTRRGSASSQLLRRRSSLQIVNKKVEEERDGHGYRIHQV